MRIRRATSRDLADLVDVHRSAFPTALMTTLGQPFLRTYYGLVLEYHLGILLMAEIEGSPQGFVGGFVAPRRFYRLLRHSIWRFLVPVAIGVASHPGLVRRVAANVRRALGNRERRLGSERSCELASIAVNPSASGKGLGKALMRTFLDEAWRLGSCEVSLTTDAYRNDRVNRFYRKLGFRCIRSFEPYRGRLLHEYVLTRDVPRNTLRVPVDSCDTRLAQVEVTPG